MNLFTGYCFFYQKTTLSHDYYNDKMYCDKAKNLQLAEGFPHENSSQGWFLMITLLTPIHIASLILEHLNEEPTPFIL